MQTAFPGFEKVCCSGRKENDDPVLMWSAV